MPQQMLQAVMRGPKFMQFLWGSKAIRVKRAKAAQSGNDKALFS